MIVTRSTLAARVAFHATPGLTASLLVLIGSSLRDPSAATLRGRGAGVGGVEHIAGVTLVTLVVGGARADTRIERMSDHTERVRKLRDRILAAKEFL
jgi:hypothetical protein